MPIKFILIGIAALAIITAIGGTIWAAKSYVDGLNTKIITQQQEIEALKIDRERLLQSNKSLAAEMKRKSDETKAAYAEIERLRKSDEKSQKRLAEVQKVLQDQERIKRLENIRKSRKASLLIRLMDKQIQCYVDNFDRFDGKCIRGKFVKNGERLVPLKEEKKNANN